MTLPSFCLYKNWYPSKKKQKKNKKKLLLNNKGSFEIYFN